MLFKQALHIFACDEEVFSIELRPWLSIDYFGKRFPHGSGDEFSALERARDRGLISNDAPIGEQQGELRFAWLVPFLEAGQVQGHAD